MTAGVRHDAAAPDRSAVDCPDMSVRSGLIALKMPRGGSIRYGPREHSDSRGSSQTNIGDPSHLCGAWLSAAHRFSRQTGPPGRFGSKFPGFLGRRLGVAPMRLVGAVAPVARAIED